MPESRTIIQIASAVYNTFHHISTDAHDQEADTAVLQAFVAQAEQYEPETPPSELERRIKAAELPIVQFVLDDIA